GGHAHAFFKAPH
ncbi:outer membrane protein, partial [Helicobacter pylori]